MAMVRHDFPGQTFREEGLNGLDPILRPSDFANIRRLHPQGAHVPRLKARQQGAIIGPNIDAQTPLLDPDPADDAIGECLLVDTQLLGNAAPIGIFGSVHDGTINHVIKLGQSARRTPPKTKWIVSLGLAEHLFGQKAVTERLVPDVQHQVEVFIPTNLTPVQLTRVNIMFHHQKSLQIE
jgi:hypothetical protein